MTTPDEIVKAIADALVIVQNAITGNYVGELPAAEKLLTDVLVALPPIDAPSLDPEDRAAADKEAADREAAKFPGPQT